MITAKVPCNAKFKMQEARRHPLFCILHFASCILNYEDPIVRSLIPRLRAFVLERHPFALPIVERVLEDVIPPAADRDPAAIEQFAQQFRRALGQAMSGLSAPDIPETTPGITAQTRLKAASQELLEDVDGFFARAAIAASLTTEERREILRGMVLTRAVDNRLKQLFIGSEVQFEGVPFQGKGFRSLGQEA